MRKKPQFWLFVLFFTSFTVRDKQHDVLDQNFMDVAIMLFLLFVFLYDEWEKLMIKRIVRDVPT